MRKSFVSTCGALFLIACGGGAPAQSAADQQNEGAAEPSGTETAASGEKSEAAADDENTFRLNDTEGVGEVHGVNESKIQATATESAMKFIVVDKTDDKPIAGIVIALTSPDKKTYYTDETDAAGYAEVLVPAGKLYELVYLSLGEKDINAKVDVPDKPYHNIKLTLRYKKRVPKASAGNKTGGPGQALQPGFVLNGVTFDSAKASIREESFPRLDSVVEYMAHKKSARIEIVGHTDNIGNASTNKTLSLKRAQACRDYLISKGIDGSRIEAKGYGSEQPVASNDTEEGRQENRRIEAREL